MGNTKYTFVVDTNSKDGAVFFDSAMFAHLTGRCRSGPYFFSRIESIKKAAWNKNRKIAAWLNDYFAEHVVSFCGFDKSVMIRFSERPATYVLQLLTSRAVEFCKKGCDNIGKAIVIPFVGCRLIKTTEVQEVETLA